MDNNGPVKPQALPSGTFLLASNPSASVSLGSGGRRGFSHISYSMSSLSLEILILKWNKNTLPLGYSHTSVSCL